MVAVETRCHRTDGEEGKTPPDGRVPGVGLI